MPKATGLPLPRARAARARAGARAGTARRAGQAGDRAAYFYKVKWGFQDEFERLFFKNHYPVLQAQMGERGRITGVEVMRPTYHGDGRADWTFLVVISFANLNAFVGPNEEAAIQKRLYPDQETFKKEEQRRFEILDAHWDVPLAEVEPPK